MMWKPALDASAPLRSTVTTTTRIAADLAEEAMKKAPEQNAGFIDFLKSVEAIQKSAMRDSEDCV